MSSFVLPEDSLERGAFGVPHVIFAADCGLDKHERVLIVVLMAVQDKNQSADGWFQVTNEQLCAQAGISNRQIPRIRQRLYHKGLLKFRRGHTGWATEYRIMIDQFYQFEQWNTKNVQTITSK